MAEPPSEQIKSSNTQGGADSGASQRGADSGTPQGKPTEASNNKTSHKWWCTHDPPMLIVTFLGVLAVLAYVCITHQQLEVMQGQLDAALADQRPWVKPEIKLIGMKFSDAKDATFVYSSTFTNVGKSPAQNIKSSLNAAIVTTETAIKSIDQERLQCSCAAANGNDSFPGIFLFPGEERRR